MSPNLLIRISYSLAEIDVEISKPNNTNKWMSCRYWKAVRCSTTID